MKFAKISVTLLDHCGTDLSVVNAARVSFDKESDWEVAGFDQTEGADHYVLRLSDRDAKLIRYLAKHKHTSPFNHAFASFRVKAPVFVARQLVKHKFLPWNEVSRRYVSSEPEFFYPKVWRCAAENVKQGSSEHEFIANHWEIRGVMEKALSLYKGLIEDGCCPEQARMVLPINCMTEWVWSGTLGAWADMCKLRLDSHAQQESREVAQLVSEQMSTLFPTSWAALLEN